MADLDIESLEGTLKNLRKKSDSPRQIQILSLLGQYYQAKRQYQKALTYFRQALNLMKGLPNSDDQVDPLINLGCVYWEMAQLKKAMMLFEEALTQTEKTGDEAGQAMLLTIIGISYWRKLELDQAMDRFEKAMQLNKKIKKHPLHLTNVEKYNELREVLERGLQTLKGRLNIARKHQEPNRILQINFSLIPLLFFTGRKEEVPTLLEKINFQAKQLNRKDLLCMIPKLQKFMNGS